MITKLWNWKAQLVGPGTTTPTLHDVTFEYRPVPDLKKRWSLSIDAGDEVMLLNKQREQRDGKSLVSDLWLEKEAKRTVVYEDVDSFSVNFVSAMTSANTSARVDKTQWMPVVDQIGLDVSFDPAGALAQPVAQPAVCLFIGGRVDDGRAVAGFEKTAAQIAVFGDIESIPAVKLP